MSAKETKPKTEWFISAALRNFMRPKGIIGRILRNLIIWVIISLILLVPATFIDQYHYGNYLVDMEIQMPYHLKSGQTAKYSWEVSLKQTEWKLEYQLLNPYRPWAMWIYIGLVVLGFNLANANVVYHDARKYNRKAKAWFVAFLFLTPLLWWIYFLTWPVPVKR